MISKQSFRAIALLFLCIVLGGASLVGYYLFLHPNFLLQRPSKALCIPRGTTFGALQRQLKNGGYIRHTAPFYLLARLLRYDRKVISGAYLIRSGMTNWEVIRLLRTGIQQPLRVVFSQANSKEEVASRLTHDLEMDASDLLQLINDPDFISQYGFNADNITAMFIPNTYEVYWNISASALFARMHKEYQSFWNSYRLDRARQIGLTPTEVTILASIIQKETNLSTEAPMIAGVYMNRLRKKIALGSCPTLLYILKDEKVKRVLKKHRHLDSPYNTYKYRGLPPGPIGVPSIAFIDAVLHFKHHNYLYFSAKEDFSGHHYFARSLKEHLRNAARYQRALNRAKIYK